MEHSLWTKFAEHPLCTSFTTVSYACSAGCSVYSYLMDGVDVSADEITWTDYSFLFSVTTEDTFSLQYSEGCCESSTDISDNDGTSCADVYFKYESSTAEPSTEGMSQVSI